jgi:CelD/BcsL family acetyltransferase involved in cellulose biosynthesis
MLVEPVQFEEIQYYSDAVALERSWSELWERCPHATVFQSPEWLLATWRHLAGRGQRLWLVSARVNGNLVGLFPLCSTRANCIGLQGEAVSDYLDILVDPLAPQDIVRDWLEYLSDAGQADSLCFAQLPHNSPLLAAEPPFEWMIAIDEQDVCPYVPLPQPGAKLEAVLPRGFCKRIEQSRRAAAREFRIAVNEAAPDEAGDYLRRLFQLHTRRWNALRNPGVLADSAIRTFHTEVAPRLMAKGRLWLLELRFDGVAVASLMALCGHGRVLYYIGGFSPEYSRFSPGRLLIASLFERALARGCTEVDFLRGVEPYKYDWGATNRSSYRMVLEPVEGQVCIAV